MYWIPFSPLPPLGLSRLILKATLPKNNLKKLGSLATVPGGPGRIPAFEK